MTLDEQLVDLLVVAEEWQQEGRSFTVAELCPDRPELWAQLRELLAGIQQLDGVLHGPEPTNTADGPPVMPAVLPVAVSGYELLREVGRGGMGVVYQARHRALKRTVALKMILAGGHAGDAERQRFCAEAEAVARLSHPNIVQVYEVGESDGLPFCALEYVAGDTLARRLGEGPLPPREAARLAADLAGAMHLAHSRNVVHRDLKPANVLLAEGGTPKITDFGLARRLDVEAGQTQTGAIVGTPSYMAPEQAAGQRQAVGPAADVWALGAILYECLTGRPPFRAESVLETLAQVRTTEPAPPRALRPSVPRDLETICFKCLRKEPEKRYASAQELADDLLRFLGGEPIRARRVPAWERAAKWVRRRPAQAAAVLLLCVSLMGGGVAYGFYKEQQFRRQQERQQQVEHEVDLAEGAGDDDEAAMQHFAAALALLDAEPGPGSEGERRRVEERKGRVAARRREKEARDHDDRKRHEAAERLARFEARQREVQFREISFTEREREADRAAVREAAAAALAEFSFSAADAPEDAAGRLDTFAPYFPPPRRADEVAAACCEALLAWADAEAPEKALHLLDLADALGRAHHVAAPRAFHLRRARCLALLGQKDAARAEQAQADQAGPGVALDLFLSARDAWVQGKTNEAAADCERVLADQPDHYWARYLLALCHLRAGRLESAKVGLSACLGARPEFIWPRLFLAVAEGGLGDTAVAEKDFAAVLRAAGDDPLARWLVHYYRGAMRAGRPDWGAAVADLEAAARLRPDAPEPYLTLAQVHRGRAALLALSAVNPEPYAALAAARAARESYADAVAALDRAVERRPDDAGLYHTRAQLQALRGDPKAAREDFERAIALRLRVPAAGRRAGDEARLLSDYVELAHLQHQAREYQAALASCDAALRLRPDYPPAHRQRAEALLALKDYAGAGQALDHYLHSGKPTAQDYLARALIHAERREYAQAVEVYGRALQFGPSADALAYRGWAYLKLDRPHLARADFEDALRLNKDHPDALCGRGAARVRLGEVPGAVEDAAAALRHDPYNRRLVLRAACIYAQAVGRLDAQWGERAWTAGPATQYQARAVELLAELLRGLPETKRTALWRDTIRDEKDLAPISRSAGFLELARAYDR
jgi:tetratricopeptide (TPR) repeat protein